MGRKEIRGFILLRRYKCYGTFTHIILHKKQNTVRKLFKGNSEEPQKNLVVAQKQGRFTLQKMG